MSVYFADLAVGDSFRSAGRTVTEADIQQFAGLSGDYNPLHTDAEWVRAHTEYRDRIAHGLLTLAMGSGMRTPTIDELHIIAYLEVQRRMIGVVYPGDTITVTHTVEELRPSRSRIGAGIAKLRVETRNQEMQPVQTGIDTLLVGGPDDEETE